CSIRGRADSLQQCGGGFVAGVLGDELAGEGPLEDALAEAGGAGEAVVDGNAGRLDLRELLGDFGDDSGLLFERWNRNGCWAHIVKIEVSACNVCLRLGNVRLERRR